MNARTERTTTELRLLEMYAWCQLNHYKTAMMLSPHGRLTMTFEPTPVDRPLSGYNPTHVIVDNTSETDESNG